MYMKRDLAGPHAVVVIEIVEMKNGAIIFDVAIPNFACGISAWFSV